MGGAGAWSIRWGGEHKHQPKVKLRKAIKKQTKREESRGGKRKSRWQERLRQGRDAGLQNNEAKD